MFDGILILYNGIIIRGIVAAPKLRLVVGKHSATTLNEAWQLAAALRYARVLQVSRRGGERRDGGQQSKATATVAGWTGLGAALGGCCQRRGARWCKR